jgi:3-phenylpropionate/cinnamic acid dioxygenase small subunit
MTACTNSHHAWPDEGATRVPYFVYEDADLYEAEQKLIFCGPVWNYLGLEVQIPSAGDYITSPIGDTPVSVLRTAEGGINALVNRCAHKGSMICYRPSGHVSELTCPSRENHANDWPVGIMYCDGHGMMQDRVTALRQAIVFEPHVYRHIFGSPLISRTGDGSYAVESNFHILRPGADGTVVTYGCGRYLDEIVHYRGDMKFRKRTRRARFLSDRHSTRDPTVSKLP